MLQLNDKFETLFLLCQCPWKDERKESFIQELDQMGLEGKEFYDQYLHFTEQYYRTFTRHLISSAGASVIYEMDTTMLAVVSSVLWSHPEWFQGIGETADEVVSEAVGTAVSQECETGDKDLIEVLEESDLSVEAKWQLTVLHRNAKRQLEQIIAAVNDNIPAYQKARDKVKTELDTLLKQFTIRTKEMPQEGLMGLAGKLDPDAICVPTLALPIAVLVLDHVCFYGVLCDKVAFGNAASLSKDELIVAAKALSEKSKLEILICLKEGSRYNLELAELIGLTPATVSHHMNVLLTSGFVGLEKRDGKVYYQLAEEGIKRFLKGAGDLLLP